MGNLVKMQAAGCGPDVRSLFAKIDQNSLAYYEFEPAQLEADEPGPRIILEPGSGLLRRWRSPEVEPAACASARLDALFARLGAGSCGGV
jgi:hypothetical protein